MTKVLVSITTTLHIQGKERFVDEVLSSLLRYHTPKSLASVTKWLVINEFTHSSFYTTLEKCRCLHKKYPFLTIVHKNSHHQGQASSLNTVLDELREGDFDYWLHVEESWVCTRTFLDDSLEFMVSHPHIHQLQLYHSDYYLNHTKHHLRNGVDMIELGSHVDTSTVKPQDWSAFSYKWPLYSLRPSVTRVDFLTKHPSLRFSTDPHLWPVAFEFEFALKWHSLGGTMCAYTCSALTRQQGHVSTYFGQ